MIDEISWQQWANLPQMSKLPLHEVERHYRIYLNEVTEQRVALMMLQERVSQAEAMAVAASNGGGSLIQQITNDGCIQFTVDTTNSLWNTINVGVDADTTYTVDWGDGTTEEGLLQPETTTIEHEYPENNQQYVTKICFTNYEAVVYLDFPGND